MSSVTELLAEPTAEVLAVPCRAKLFRGLADSSRLAILESLRSGALSVSEIVAVTGLSQPNASNHLRCVSVRHRGLLLPRLPPFGEFKDLELMHVGVWH